MVRSKLTFFVFPYSFLHTPGLIVTFKDQACEIGCKPFKFCFICSGSDENFWWFGTHVHIAGVSVSHTDSLKDSLFLNVHLSVISFVCIIIYLKSSYPNGTLPEKKTFLSIARGRGGGRKPLANWFWHFFKNGKVAQIACTGGGEFGRCPKVRVFFFWEVFPYLKPTVSAGSDFQSIWNLVVLLHNHLQEDKFRWNQSVSCQLYLTPNDYLQSISLRCEKPK